MVKNIIFDIGGVLTNIHFEAVVERYCNDKKIIRRVYEGMMGADAWSELDRGILTEEQVVDLFVEKVPDLEDLIRKVFADMGVFLTRCEYAIPWIKQLHDSGYKVYYLSNWPERFYKQFIDCLDFIPYTDGGILSFREHLIKPEPAIYQLLLTKFCLEASECVFIDDTEKNLVPARDMGIQTILFTSQEDAINKLEKMGVK